MACTVPIFMALFLSSNKMEALHLTKNSTNVSLHNSKQTKPVFGDDACMEYAGGFVVAETSNFYIEICGSKDTPLSYYGFKKNSSNSRSEIVLDLQSYTFNNKVTSQNERFIAVNGDTRYTLTPNSLIVKQGDKILVNEKVVKYKRLVSTKAKDKESSSDTWTILGETNTGESLLLNDSSVKINKILVDESLNNEDGFYDNLPKKKVIFFDYRIGERVRRGYTESCKNGVVIGNPRWKTYTTFIDYNPQYFVVEADSPASKKMIQRVCSLSRNQR